MKECDDGAVRLVDGERETEGRVEICLGEVWGTICNDHWSEEDTMVLCQELGLKSSGIAYTSHQLLHNPFSSVAAIAIQSCWPDPNARKENLLSYL